MKNYYNPLEIIDPWKEFFRDPINICSNTGRYSKTLPEKGVLHIKNMFDSVQLMNLLQDDFKLVKPNDDIFDEERHGKSHKIIGLENMKILKRQTETLNLIEKHLCDYFDLEPAQVRVNRYLSDELKPAHQDAAAVFKSKASKDQNITVALSLGSGRPIRFKSLHSDASVELLNVEPGDVYTFPREVNQSFTSSLSSK